MHCGWAPSSRDADVSGIVKELHYDLCGSAWSPRPRYERLMAMPAMLTPLTDERMAAGREKKKGKTTADASHQCNTLGVQWLFSLQGAPLVWHPCLGANTAWTKVLGHNLFYNESIRGTTRAPSFVVIAASTGVSKLISYCGPDH